MPSDDSAPPGDATPPLGSETAPMVTLRFAESDAEIVNPERGYYVGVDLLSPGSAAPVRARGHSLAIALVRLDAHRDEPLDAGLLAALDGGFAAVRAAGIKVILRFAYNASFGPDAARSVILGHIAQLAPLLQRHADVIAVMQAGFIGAWGEWHSSTHKLDNDDDRSEILSAILKALPVSRSVQVRTPMYKAGIYSREPLSEAEAFDGSDRARVGHHNDSLLASSRDYGTYESPVARWRSFIAQDSRFTPMGGETCAVSERTDCATALAELATNHWSYLNQEYQPAVIAGWETQGCASEIRRRLGYRLVLGQAALSAKVAPGGELALALDLSNTGYAAPFNFRPAYIVLGRGVARRVARLDAVDVRRWQGGEATRIAVTLRVPADAAPGLHRVALWMPDDAASLRDDPRYAIRLANDDLWDAATGENVISEQLRVDASTPGAVEASACDLAVIG